MTTFKIYFSELNIRRITPKSTPSYSEFTALLSNSYPEYTLNQYAIKYIDQENDKIEVSSQLEWEEMISIFENDDLIKIYLEIIPKKIEKKRKRSVPKKENAKKANKTKRGKKKRAEEKAVVPEVTVEDPYKFLKDVQEKILDEAMKIIDNNKDMEFELPELKMPENMTENLMKCFNDGMKIVEDGIVKGYCNISDMMNNTNFDEFYDQQKFNETFDSLMTNLDGALKNINVDMNIFDKKEEQPEIVNIEKKIEIPAPDILSFDESFNESFTVPEVPQVADSYVYDKVKLDIQNDNLSDSLIDLRTKWGAQLSELKQLGFLCDDEVLALILEQSGGNLSDAVMVLLQNSMNK